MKENVFKLTMLGVVLVFGLTSCTSLLSIAADVAVISSSSGYNTDSKKSIVYDPKLSQQEQSILIIAPYVYFNLAGFGPIPDITGSFDDDRVVWRAGEKIFIPSGSHTLVYHYQNTKGDPRTGRSIKEVTKMRITYDFKPGYVYTADVKIDEKLISPVIEEKGMLLWKFPPVSNTPTKFEGTWESKGATIVFSGNTIMVEPQKSSGSISKSVFTFTNQTIVMLEFASRGKSKTEWKSPEYSYLNETKYELKPDGTLLLTAGGTTTSYKKK